VLTRLRVHLVGPSLLEKEEMALSLRASINRRKRTDFVIVPSLVEKVRERQSIEDIGFFMALESEYLGYEADRDTKAKHLVFVDSLVDRLVRIEDKGIDLRLYFLPRLLSCISDPGHVFVYGPELDDKRSSFIARHRIPAQVWTGKGCLEAVVESVLLSMRREHGK
jgi:hypothetical protein